MAKQPSARDELIEHYKGLDRGELQRQGAAYLRGRADRQVLGVRRWLWRLVGLVLLLAVIGTGVLCWRALKTAQTAGAGMAEAKRELMNAYGVGGD